MTWYITILYWIIAIIFLGAICKYLIPKWVWAKAETAIINWQTRSITGQFIEKKPSKKYGRLLLFSISLSIGIILSMLFTWLVGVIAGILVYFGLGVYLMQRGVIE